MAFIDVTDLLTDPEIAGQSFTVLRSAITVGTDGQSSATATTIPIIGSVQPAKSSDMQRLPDGTSQVGTIRIRTTFRLTSGGASTGPDVIVWPASTGLRYVVQTSDDWTQFGAGFIDALATLADINPTS